MLKNTIKYITVVIVILMIGACSRTAPPKVYLLKPLPHTTTAKKQHDEKVKIGVGPVTIPLYLKQPQIITTTKKHRVHLNEFQRWAEPLDENITRVLAENLAVIVPADHFATYPWNRTTEIDYQIKVTVYRFDTHADGQSFLKARWKIIRPEDKKVLRSKTAQYRSQVKDLKDYKSIVLAMNANLTRMTRDIARAVRRVERAAK